MDDLAEMIRQLHESGGDCSERRKAKRIVRQGILSIQIPGPQLQSQTVTVQFRDCSSTGIGFESDLPMDVSSRFDVVITHPQQGNLVLSYEVVRCDRRKDNIFMIGAKLIR